MTDERRQPTWDELRAKLGDGVSGKVRYAAPPGTGPAGETCRTCKHLAASGHYPKLHYKCGKTAYTHGDATTIKVRSPACRLWERFDPGPNDRREELK